MDIYNGLCLKQMLIVNSLLAVEWDSKEWTHMMKMILMFFNKCLTELSKVSHPQMFKLNL
jgi:hypothetical protein